MTGVGVALLSVLLVHSRHGIELTDEGFYLNWIARPWVYPTSATQFGFVYHPVYLAVDGSVALMRQLNVALTILLAFALSWIVIRRGRPLDPEPSLHRDVMRAFLLAIPVLGVFSLGLVTPSYNSLVLQGAIVVAAGLVLTLSSSTLGALLVGLGGVVVFLAKPSSAALIAVAALVFILTTNATPFRTLAISISTTLVAMGLAALSISGGPAAFVERLMGGHESLVILTPNYTLDASLRLDALDLTATETAAFWLLSGIAFCIVWLVSIRPNLGPPVQILIAAAALAASAYCLLSPESLSAISAAPRRTAILLAAVPIGLALAALLAGLGTSRARAWPQHTTAAALLFACMPFFVAFGTAGNTMGNATCAALFWALGAFVLVRAAFPNAASRAGATALVASGLAITVALIAATMEFPFRQHAALRLQDRPVMVGPDRDQALLVDAETERYLAELNAALERLGFRPGDGVIDMTGESPGVIYAIGGVALGEPWLLGSYPGSEAFATRALASVACEDLAKAWILLAPEGRRALPDRVLASTGRSAQGNLDSARVRRRSLKDYHVVLPPGGESALAACRSVREHAPSQ